MRHATVVITLTLTLIAALENPASAGEPRIELRLRPVHGLCPSMVELAANRRGFDRIGRFLAERVCAAAAVDVALRALEVASGAESPADVARERIAGCDVRCWFNRPTAVIADAGNDPDAWPEPPQMPGGRWWLFFLASPDLSDHWYWVAVRERADDDGRAIVLLWSER